MLFYCPFQRKHRVANALIEMGGQVTEFEFTSNGLTTWSVHE
jgi:galactokinase/mevalonate kinase-like predicted kinase